MSALAKHMAMPPPMVPAPTIPAADTGRVGVDGGMSSILAARRWAKKKWRWAADWGPPISSTSVSRSRTEPASKSIDTALAMEATISSGARKPLVRLAIRALNWSKTDGSARASASLASRSRTLGWGPPFAARRRAKATAPARRLSPPSASPPVLAPPSPDSRPPPLSVSLPISFSRLAGSRLASFPRPVSLSPSSLMMASISPQTRASAASMGSPVTHISRALATPTRRGSRWVPPAPGSIPSFTSGSPSRAEAAATR